MTTQDVINDRSIRRDYPHESKPGWAVELYMGHYKRGAGATYSVAARPVELKDGYRVLELLGPHEERLDLPAEVRFNKKKLLQSWETFVNSSDCKAMVEKVKQSIMIAGRS